MMMGNSKPAYKFGCSVRKYNGDLRLSLYEVRTLVQKVRQPNGEDRHPVAYSSTCLRVDMQTARSVHYAVFHVLISI